MRARRELLLQRGRALVSARALVEIVSTGKPAGRAWSQRCGWRASFKLIQELIAKGWKAPPATADHRKVKRLNASGGDRKRVSYIPASAPQMPTATSRFFLMA